MLTLIAGVLGGLAALVVLTLALGAVATGIIVARIQSRFPPSGRFVEVEGGRLALLEAGPGEGHPSRGTVVLLHGASGNAADLMHGIGRRLAGDGFRVVAFDRPGFGYSDRIAGAKAASPAVQADILSAALDRLGIGPAIIVGHSWSGALATNLALDHAAHVAGLALLAPATHPWPGDAIDWYNRAASTPWLAWLFTHTLTAPAGLALMPAALKAVFAPQTVPPDYAEATRVPLVLRPGTFVANAQDLTGLHAFVTAQAPRYAAIHVPTLVMTGDRDRIVSPDIHARALARQISGVELVILPGIGHMLHQVAVDPVVAGIESLATRVGGQHAVVPE